MTRHLITSALPYINGVKHLGNLAGSLLPADVYARFLRLDRQEVLFICATDEHGTPAELSAQEAGLPVREYCDTMHAVQASIYNRFGLSFNHFGRTSSIQNAELTARFYHRLLENGFIEEREVSQIYSPEDGRFLPDRYVIGTCPHCGYGKARGDQCENCTSLLNPTSLLQPRSAISGSTDLEVRATNHLFLRLDALSDEIQTFIDSRDNWSRLTESIARKWLDEGLEPRGITRDLSWGVPVPRDGYEGKAFYVWFDAPIGYIGSTKEWSDKERIEERLDTKITRELSDAEGIREPSDVKSGTVANARGSGLSREWESWWLAETDVSYTQFMAKDNVPFHAVFFPAMVLGTREPWTLPTQIKSFNWLTYYGGKFSTSQKRGVFLDEALDLFPADCWRYYLIANSPEADDASFTWELFAGMVNKDLVGNFGNFVNRVLKLAAAQFGIEVEKPETLGSEAEGQKIGRVPHEGTPGAFEAQLQKSCESAFAEYRQHLSQLEFRKAALALKTLWSQGNVYLDKRAPWNLVKTDRNEAALVLRTAIHLVLHFASAAEPILPFSAQKVYDALNVKDFFATGVEPSGDRRNVSPSIWRDGAWNLDDLLKGQRFRVPEPIFRRIDTSEIHELEERFGGGQERR